MTDDSTVREQLVKLLSWEDAHVSFDAAVANLPAGKRGSAPAGLPYSPWQLVEHLRITQHDILDFCRNPGYQERSWPKDYWPGDASPPSADAWSGSIEEFRRDRSGLER